MMISRLRAAFAIFILGAGSLGAQVIFSRRVYAERGRTYQQIWEWQASDGSLMALTHSPRNHLHPMGSRDGKRIFFLTGSGDWETTGVWSFDRRTGLETEILAGLNFVLIGIARNGTPLVSTEQGAPLGEQKVFRASPSPILLGSFCGEAVSPDGARLAFNHCVYADQTIHDGKELFVTDTITGKTKIQIGNCNRPAWSPDGSRIACSAGQDIVILDVAAKRELDRIRFPGRPTPPGAGNAETLPEMLEYSQDGKSLLVGTRGEHTNSTSPESDYFVPDLGLKTWTPACSSNDAMWLPGRNAILFITPRDLAPLRLTNKTVWVDHLALFDIATRQQNLLTSGTTNDIDPAWRNFH